MSKKKKKLELKKKYITSFFSKLLCTIVISLIALIFINKNQQFKTDFYHHVYDQNISFATINNWYKKYFGSSIPFKNLVSKKDKQVFDEKLNYKSKKQYLDGVKLEVDKNYVVPVMESGMVVYIGKKESYGNTVIVQQIDGMDVWYGNVDTKNIKLYDYVEKGKLLGEVKNSKLYLVFKKDGKALSYEKYL